MKFVLCTVFSIIVQLNVYAGMNPTQKWIHIFYAFPQGESYNIKVTLENDLLKKFARSMDFQIIPHFKATRYDVEDVMRNTRGFFFVLWSSHGGSDGTLYDYYGYPLPKDIFDSRLCHADGYPLGILISSCYSGVTLKTYRFGNSRVITTGSFTTVNQTDFKRAIDKWLVAP